MSVAQLLCEGRSGSPDARVLNKILDGLCKISPMGPKYGLGAIIRGIREVEANPYKFFGIIDRDFVTDWIAPQNIPCIWEAEIDNENVHFGWRWERKEIENYLIDPEVVMRALGAKAPDENDFLSALQSARDSIEIYEAARTALNANRIRQINIPSSFGQKRGKEKHLFPNDLTMESCRIGINDIVQSHQQSQTIEPDDVMNSFEQYLVECSNGGARKQHFLHAFAGKDLFWAMNQWFVDNGYIGAMDFRERVLSGIQRASEDISYWLPEWAELKNMIKET